MKIKLLASHFTVCRIEEMSAVNWDSPFCFAARTDEECSLVCPTEFAPANILAREDGWRAMRIEGVLDFSLVGILAGITAILAQNRIPVFAVSTYNTDYLLVKEEQLLPACEALKINGYEVE